MKLNFKNSQNNTHLSRHRNNILAQTAYKDKYKNKENKNKNINTHRPAQDISFGGSAVSGAKKIIQNKALNKLVNVVNDNEVAYNAIYSLLVAGMLKPLCVLNMPGSEDKDKQIVATKNFLQAFIGSFLSFTIGGKVIKKSIDVIKNNLKLIQLPDENATNKALKTVSPTHKNAISQAKKILGNNASEEEIKQKAKEIVENFEKKHLKLFNRNPEFIEKLLKSAKNKDANATLMDAFESFWKNSTGWITAIGKAKISSILLPTVMAALFAKKNLEKEKSKQGKSQDKLISQNSSLTLINSKSFQQEQSNFKAFFNNSQGKVSFTGKNELISKALNSTIEGLAKGVEFLATTKAGEAAVTGLSKLPPVLNKPSARMGDIESFLITAYWVNNTNKSKKIDPDQKLGLNVHTVLVTAVSSVASFIIDTLLDTPITKAKESYKETLEGVVNKAKEISTTKEQLEFIKENCKDLINPDEIVKTLFKNDKLIDENLIKSEISNLANTYQKKLSKFKSLTVFTTVVRFLIPVLMVPVSGKMKRKINAWNKERQEQKASKS